ncbi:MAG: hypothetical protein V1776_03240 [Candidatus Diapherotrites archaeon]
MKPRRRIPRFLYRMFSRPFLRLYRAFHDDGVLSKGKGIRIRKRLPKVTIPKTVDDITDPWVRVSGHGLGRGKWVRLSSLPPEQQKLFRDALAKRRGKK